MLITSAFPWQKNSTGDYAKLKRLEDIPFFLSKCYANLSKIFLNVSENFSFFIPGQISKYRKEYIERNLMKFFNKNAGENSWKEKTLYSKSIFHRNVFLEKRVPRLKPSNVKLTKVGNQHFYWLQSHKKRKIKNSS